MIRQFRVNNIYADHDTWDRLELLCNEFGWHKKTIIRRCIHGFLQRHGSFYAQAAILDAKSRGIKAKEYFFILRDQEFDDLPEYRSGRSPDFGSSPLATYPPLSTRAEYRRAYNEVTLSAYNYVLFRTALIVERVSISQLIGRMILRHFDDDWVLYQQRMDRDRAGEFILEAAPTKQSRQSARSRKAATT